MPQLPDHLQVLLNEIQEAIANNAAPKDYGKIDWANFLAVITQLIQMLLPIILPLIVPTTANEPTT
jgi:mannose/fructose/N-acetylgalactosamine-specific phosphotransferase system component IIC